MHERELLDLLAGGAPEPSAGLPDRVVAAGRRARRRRRAGAGAAAGLVVAAGLVFTLPRSDGHVRTVADPPAAVNIAPSSKTPSSDGLSAPDEESRSKAFSSPELGVATADSRVRIYTAVIGKALVRETAEKTQSPAAIYVVDRACPLQGACTGPVFDEAFKTSLAAALGSDQVSFGPEANATAQPGPVVRIGEIKLTGKSAVVPVSVMRHRNGIGEGSGMTYQLKSKNGQWRVVGTAGPSWIT
jgi:hypothetical protein